MNEKTSKLEKPSYALRHTYNSVTRWGELKACVGPDYILFGVRSVCAMLGFEWKDTSTEGIYDVSRTHKITVSSNDGTQKIMMLTHEGMRQWLDYRTEAAEFLKWIDSVFTEEVAQARPKLFKGATQETQVALLMAWLVRSALALKKTEQPLEIDELLAENDYEVPGSVSDFVQAINKCSGGKVNRNAMYDVLLRAGYIWKHWPSGYSVVEGKASPYFEGYLAEDEIYSHAPYIQLTQRGRMHFAKLFRDAYERLVSER